MHQLPTDDTSQNMHRVALTGGIATGKTHVLHRFASLGVPTVDADHLVHGLLGTGTGVSTAVASRFGADMLLPDGRVDRRRLGKLVFSDDEARRDLEGLVHPAVYARIDEWFGRLNPTEVAFAVADVPLLYETNRAQFFDRVIVTVCSPELQISRVMARDGISEIEARRRLAAQWPGAEKARRADFVIQTEGATADTDRRVDEIARILRSEK